MLKEINAQSFESETQDGFSLVDCYGTHCGPCQTLAKTLEALSIDYPFINILKINMDENHDFQKKHHIMAVPTLFLVIDGKIEKRITGALSQDELLEAIRDYLYD